jgi:hypothetical protein
VFIIDFSLFFILFLKFIFLKIANRSQDIEKSIHSTEEQNSYNEECILPNVLNEDLNYSQKEPLFQTKKGL